MYIPRFARNDDDVLGTRVDTMGYTLGIDIDHCEGTDIHDPAVKQAVEECAKFFVKELTQYLPKSVHACQSGGGIYYIHIPSPQNMGEHFSS